MLLVFSDLLEKFSDFVWLPTFFIAKKVGKKARQLQILRWICRASATLYFKFKLCKSKKYEFKIIMLTLM